MNSDRLGGPDRIGGVGGIGRVGGETLAKVTTLRYSLLCSKGVPLVAIAWPTGRLTERLADREIER